MTTELKPCPHCGGPAKIFEEHWVICKNNCQPMGRDIQRIAEAWNTRPEEDRLRARIAELEFNQCIHPDGLGVGRSWKGKPYCRMEEQ